MTWFSDNDLRRLAGSRSYAAGQGYVDEVSDLVRTSAEVCATVYGTAPYQVRLSNQDGAISAVCSCLWAQEGNFCKHCVAVGLAVLASSTAAGAAARLAPEPDERIHEGIGIAAYLDSASQAELADLVAGLAAENKALRRRLELRAAGAKPAQAELDALIGALRIRDAQYLDPARYASEADAALRMLSQLAADHPRQVGVAYLQALRQITKTDEEETGEDGEERPSESKRGVAARLVAGFACACRADPPSPDRLAGCLVELALGSPDWLDIPIGAFSAALGARGLASYGQRLSEAAGSAAATEAGHDEHDREPRAERLMRLREAYLEHSGDISGLVAHYAETLPEPDRYLRTGEMLRAAGRPEEAIDWLRRGQHHSGYQGGRIRDLLAVLYADTGQHAEALRVRWDSFTRYSSEHSYRSLLQAAGRADSAAQVKDRAIALLREQAAAGGHADTLVNILLASGETDDAWAAARRFGCSSKCLLGAAKVRGRTHPADAIPVYKQAVEDAIAGKDRSGYRQAAVLLPALKDLHQRAGLDFSAYLSDLKSTYRRRTSLMEELAVAGL